MHGRIMSNCGHVTRHGLLAVHWVISAQWRLSSLQHAIRGRHWGGLRNEILSLDKVNLYSTSMGDHVTTDHHTSCNMVARFYGVEDKVPYEPGFYIQYSTKLRTGPAVPPRARWSTD